MGKKKADLGLLAGLGKRIVDTVRITGEAVVGKPKKQLGNTTITPSFTADRAFVYGAGAIVFVGGGYLIYELVKRGLATINPNPTPNQPNATASQPIPRNVSPDPEATEPQSVADYVVSVKKGLKALGYYNNSDMSGNWGGAGSAVDNALRQYANDNSLSAHVTTATKVGDYTVRDWDISIKAELLKKGKAIQGIAGFASLSGINGLGCGCMHA